MNDIIENVTWSFPPTYNRNGRSRAPYDTISIIKIHSDLFTEPTIVMSDIHGNTNELIHMLNEYVNLSKFIVITAGDMAGQHLYGSDGDPSDYYEFLKNQSLQFYYVQGNHDLPSKKKIDGSLDCKTVNTSIGKIGGVDGIISGKNHAYKFYESDYMAKLRDVLMKNPHIIVTHDTPSIPINNKYGERYIGRENIYEMINKSKVKIHIYGHCHHEQIINVVNGKHYINVDGRVLIFIPDKNLTDESLFHKKLIDTYSISAKNLK